MEILTKKESILPVLRINYWYGKRINIDLSKMKKYLCPPCGFIYDPAVGDPESGIAPGTPFEQIPDDWLCPWCFVTKDEFVVVE